MIIRRAIVFGGGRVQGIERRGERGEQGARGGGHRTEEAGREQDREG